MTFSQIAFLLISYLIAAIPFGLVLAKKFAGIDIREHGSKNIGATNVARLAGKKLGFVTLILDSLKGGIMVLLARHFFIGAENLSLFLVLVAGVCVLGHVYPIYLKFKGGKGVATTMAVLLALNWQVGLIVAFLWLACFLLFRISSLASISSTFFAGIAAYFLVAPREQVIFCFLLFALILYRHKENILRLLSGKEKKL